MGGGGGGVDRPIKTGLGFKCDQCGCLYMHLRNLDRHASRNHTDNPTFNCNQCGKSYARSGNLEMHKRTCTRPTAAAPAVKRRRTGDVVPDFTVRKTRKSLGGAAEMFAVNMKEANHLSALEESVNALKPAMDNYHRDHRAYKFQIAVDVIFHKAVDPAVITQPPVTLTSEMVAVYSGDAPPLADVNRQLVNLVEVYEHNGSGWVFSNFATANTLAPRSSSCKCLRTITSLDCSQESCYQYHWNW